MGIAFGRIGGRLAFGLFLLLLAGRPGMAGMDDVAVIIGNRDYQKEEIPDVTFAIRDAAAMKRFVTDVLEVDEENIIYLENATQTDLLTAFGSRDDIRGTLWSYIDPAGGSNVTVFYSGHGTPGQRDKRGYLLPVDADPNTVEINGYPIDLLYDNLARLESKSTTVYLDACFSGGSESGMLLRDASPFGIQVTVPETGNAMTVLTASSGDQIASWDRKAQHGLFTHHLLDALYGKADRDQDNQVTVSEVQRYLNRYMTRAARRTYRRIQNASVSGPKATVLAAVPAEAERPTLSAIGTARGGEDGASRTDHGAPPPSVRTPASPPAPISGPTTDPGLSNDERAWRLVDSLTKKADKRRALAVFLEKYPNSPHAPEAEILLLALADFSAAAPAVRAANPGAIPLTPAKPGVAVAAVTAPPDLSPRPAASGTPSAKGPAQAAEPEPGVTVLNDVYVVLKHSNLRAGPGTHFARVGRLAAGSKVTVTGKMSDAPWFRIHHQGGTAYIWEPLLALPTAAVATRALATAGRSSSSGSSSGGAGRWREPVTGMLFARVPGGTFRMGCGSWNSRCFDDERPIRSVTLSSFWMGVHEVTQGQWKRVMKTNPSFFKKGDAYPVEEVSWVDAQTFIKRLNGLGSARFRLPSEAEWEYACRGGGRKLEYAGTGGVSTVAWYKSTSRGAPQPVGQRAPNRLGLFDMSGNVFEWVQDVYRAPYRGGARRNPVQKSGGRNRVARGGAWDRAADSQRCTTDLRNHRVLL